MTAALLLFPLYFQIFFFYITIKMTKHERLVIIQKKISSRDELRLQIRLHKIHIIHLSKKIPLFLLSVTPLAVSFLFYLL